MYAIRSYYDNGCILCLDGKQMKRFFKSNDGNILFLSIILFTVVIFIALGVFTWSMLYTNYYGAQSTMERSINSAVEEFLNSYEVKDVVRITSYNVCYTKLLRGRFARYRRPSQYP